MSQYTLTYFNGEGLGEAIRLLLSYGKVDFIDKRIEVEEWSKIKESKDEKYFIICKIF